MRKTADELMISKGVTIPRGLWKAARVHAKRTNQSFSKLVTLALHVYLKTRMAE